MHPPFLMEFIKSPGVHNLYYTIYVEAFLENSLELVPVFGKTSDPSLTFYESYVRGGKL